MSAAVRTFVTACAATIAFALGYATPALFHAPNLYYDPIGRRFLVGPRPGSLPMGYYGQVMWGLALGVFAGLVAWALARRRRADPAPSTLTLLGAWALTAVTLVGVYFTWNNWP